MSGRPVNFISWNINGCSNPLKRRKLLSYLKNNQVDVAFIQDTHMRGVETEKFKVGWVGHIFHSSFSSNHNGVLILIHKNISFTLLKQTKDTEGRVVCVEAVIEGTPVVLCNIYAPNQGNPIFFTRLTRSLVTPRVR